MDNCTVRKLNSARHGDRANRERASDTIRNARHCPPDNRSRTIAREARAECRVNLASFYIMSRRAREGEPLVNAIM